MVEPMELFKSMFAQSLHTPGPVPWLNHKVPGQ